VKNIVCRFKEENCFMLCGRSSFSVVHLILLLISSSSTSVMISVRGDAGILPLTPYHAHSNTHIKRYCSCGPFSLPQPPLSRSVSIQFKGLTLSLCVCVSFALPLSQLTFTLRELYWHGKHMFTLPKQVK
jgi:hypothetical protein